MNRKSMDDIDKKDSEFKDTSTKNKLALITPIENTENTNMKKTLTKETLILGIKMKVN